MRRDRFFVPTDFAGLVLEWFDKDLSHQLKKVLRFSDRDEFYLFNGRGEEAKVSLLEEKGFLLKFKILDVKLAREEINEVTLYSALLKKDNFELVIQKSVEVGVSTIVPILTKRTVKQGERLERWRQIAKEAAEQSGRLILPKIEKPLNFSFALDRAKKTHQTNFIFDATGETFKKSECDSLGIFVGPEGGFTEEEIFEAEKTGFYRTSLSNFVFRAETAAIIATFISTGGWSR